MLKGAGQHVEGQGLPSTFTNQTVCQPIGTDVFGEDILLLVGKKVWYVNMLDRLWPRASGLPPFNPDRPKLQNSPGVETMLHVDCAYCFWILLNLESGFAGGIFISLIL